MKHAMIRAIVLSLCLLGCTEPGANAQSTAAPALSLTPGARSKLEQVLASYENIRDKLAKDAVTEITADAGALATAATAAAAELSGEAQATLRALATAAGKLKDLDKSNADAVRKAFGEVSKPLVALIAMAPELAAGRFVFRCPMAQGYQKWVQTSRELANPYMGKKMLACGSPSDWSRD